MPMLTVTFCAEVLASFVLRRRLPPCPSSAAPLYYLAPGHHRQSLAVYHRSRYRDVSQGRAVYHRSRISDRDVIQAFAAVCHSSRIDDRDVNHGRCAAAIYHSSRIVDRDVSRA